MSKLRVNVVSESEISVQGHGVHTAYEEMCRGLEARDDVVVTRGRFRERVDCDIIHLHTVGSRVWGKLLQPGPKVVVSAHVVPDSFIGSLIAAQLWRPLAKWYLRWFYNKADLLLAVSAQTQRELQELGVTAPIEVLHNSVDTARYQAVSPAVRQGIRRRYSIAKERFVVIGAGQVQPRKRVDLFVEAAKALPDVTFVWVGGIPFGHLAADYRDMERLMDEQLPNMVFTGMVELADMPSLYAMADLFWLPSEQETFGLVVVEAAAAGLPVLLRQSDDYTDTFGTDVRYGTDDTFVDDVRLIATDAAVRQALREGAGRLAARFDSKAVIERLVELYRGLLR